MSKMEGTLFQKQYSEYGKSVDTKELFRYAGKHFNKRPFSLFREWWPLALGNGKLTFQDYFSFQLYDDSKYSPEQKARFISDQIQWPIVEKCCDLTWKATTEDKWLSYNLLEKYGIKTPETIAVVDYSPRLYGSDLKITSPVELKSFLQEQNQFPLFAKPNRGICSYGCLVITGVDSEHIFFDQMESMTYELFFKTIIGKDAYLIQHQVKNHPDVEKFSRYVGTVRTVNLIKEDSVSTPFTVYKIPSKTNIADNFWRKGNVVCNVDPETGVIKRAVCGKGIHSEELEYYPDSEDRLVGITLPDWQELRRLNEQVARLFAPVRYQSLDIAFTSDGPIVMEINTGGSFNLVEIASGVGFLTDEIYEFFKSCGWKFRT